MRGVCCQPFNPNVCTVIREIRQQKKHFSLKSEFLLLKSAGVATRAAKLEKSGSLSLKPSIGGGNICGHDGLHGGQLNSISGAYFGKFAPGDFV